MWNFYMSATPPLITIDFTINIRKKISNKILRAQEFLYSRIWILSFIVNIHGKLIWCENLSLRKFSLKHHKKKQTCMTLYFIGFLCALFLYYVSGTFVILYCLMYSVFSALLPLQRYWIQYSITVLPDITCQTVWWKTLYSLPF